MYVIGILDYQIALVSPIFIQVVYFYSTKTRVLKLNWLSRLDFHTYHLCLALCLWRRRFKLSIYIYILDVHLSRPHLTHALSDNLVLWQDFALAFPPYSWILLLPFCLSRHSTFSCCWQDPNHPTTMDHHHMMDYKMSTIAPTQAPTLVPPWFQH